MKSSLIVTNCNALILKVNSTGDNLSPVEFEMFSTTRQKKKVLKFQNIEILELLTFLRQFA